MSFSQAVKVEILKNFEGDGCCSLSFLSSVFHTAGVLGFSKEGMKLSLSTESLALYEFIAELLLKRYNLEVRKKRKKVLDGTKKSLHTLTVSGENAKEILFDCGILKIGSEGSTEINPGLDEYLVENECCKRSYIAGAFCGCGYAYVSKEGEKSNTVHIEFVLSSGILAEELLTLFQSFSMTPKLTVRGESTILYFKDAGQASDFLALLGASRAVLTLSEVVIEREMSNNENRRNNCILANVDKSFDAAIRQIEAIEIIDKTVGLKELPKRLKETAEMRLEFKSESLEELAARLNLTKSGINHRMRKILDIAAKMQ